MEALNNKTKADALIAAANELLAVGDIEGASPMYVQAAALFAPYASFEIVAADKLRELGRREAAVASYQRVVAAVPEHAQAWESLALTLYELGRSDEANRAMMRANELGAELERDAALHDFLARSQHQVGADYAGLEASILVRLKTADFVDWYSDGPAPDSAAISEDVAKYLRSNPRPPSLEQQQPIWNSPPPTGSR